MHNFEDEVAGLERPDEHMEGDEQYCWMPGSAENECTGSCVARDPNYVEGDIGTTPCMALNTLRSVGMSVALQSKLAHQQSKKADVAARQAAAASPPVPEVS